MKQMLNSAFGIIVCFLCLTLLSACQQSSPKLTSGLTSDVDQISIGDNPHLIQQRITVKKPSSDTKEYRYLRLDNGLKVLLISDPKAQKSSASLDVNVGSGADPKGREGLAHFLEHMLFLGTQKYPKPGEYQAFIQRHGGSYNAYTSYAHTNYFFDIQPLYFEQAFDRFAQFFIAPLFSPELVERERKAVFSEYAARIKNESRRSLDALKSVVDQRHPFAKFSVGSDKSLSGDQLRDDVIAFYNTYYSADQMALVVTANKSLDLLEALVKNEMVKVAARSVPEWRADTPLFSSNALPALLSIKPEKSLRQLKLSFPIASPKSYYRSKPLSYLAHILGYEGKGSLLSELKRLDLATAISAGEGMRFASESSFVIGVVLTPKGEKSWKQVVELVFSAINRIKSQPVRAHLYRDLAKISELEYRFKDLNSSLNKTIYYAANLHNYEPEDVLIGPYLYDNFQSKLIERFLADLNPNNMLISLTSKLVETDQISPWFYSPYQFRSLSAQWVRELGKMDLHQNITLPTANPFLPDDLTINTVDEPLLKPKLIFDQKGVRFWYNQDAQFLKPKTQWVFSLLSHSVALSSNNYAANILHAELLGDVITELSYPALMAGLRFSVSAQKLGLSLRLSGYSDKQPQLLEQLLDLITQKLDDQSRFNALRHELIQYYRNQTQGEPYKVAIRAVTDRLITPSYSPKMIANALENLTWEQFYRSTDKFWQHFQIEGLVNGNSRLVDVKPIVDSAIAKLLAKRSGAHIEVKPMTVDVLSALTPLTLDIETTHKDNALVLYYQFPSGVNGLAAASMTAKLLETRFYHDLRTLKQLGYVVFATTFNLKQQGGIAFVIQSPKVEPKELQKYVKAFIQRFNSQYLMGEDKSSQFAVVKKEFETVKDSIKNELSAPAKNLREQTGRFWRDISDEQWKFDSRQKLITALDGLTFDEWLGVFQRSLINQPRSLSVWSNH